MASDSRLPECSILQVLQEPEFELEDRMTEQENASQEGSHQPIESEFKRLGDNLQKAIKAAWDSEERKSISLEIEEGLKSVGEAVNKAADDIANSETAQKVRGEVEETAERVRSGEFADKARQELVKLLDKLNSELEEAAAKWRDEPGEADQGAETEG